MQTFTQKMVLPDYRAKEDIRLDLGDRLDLPTRKALKVFKQFLEVLHPENTKAKDSINKHT
ncbi:hypothetical protein [Desulfosporosinus orientis]|uniref:hypothetical protein n=1 Tax=Desulfosporosinus orientis TaxID=1563 RepID=UPI0002F83E4E|nr:hypothetical protein [Desulfosporosinus orientis]